jgi:hypothetical protein
VEADQWLERDSLALFEHLAPEYMSGQELQRMLFKHLTNPKKAKRLYSYLRGTDPQQEPTRRLCPECGAVLVEDACTFC